MNKLSTGRGKLFDIIEDLNPENLILEKMLKHWEGITRAMLAETNIAKTAIQSNEQIEVTEIEAVFKMVMRIVKAYNTKQENIIDPVNPS